MFFKTRSLTITGAAFLCSWTLICGQILSRGGVVTMSSRWSDWAGSRAVDGHYNTSADSCDCCASTDIQSDPWIKVDLGDTFIITRVLVYGGTDGHNQYNLTGLKINTDQDQFTPPHYIWTMIDTFYNYVFDRPISTRTIRLSLPGRRRLVICELDVYNDRVISKGKHVVMSSQLLSYTGNLSVDGNTNTNAVDCKCCASTRCNTTTWLRLDLGDYFNINYMVIYGRTDGWYPGQSYEGMKISFDDRIVHRIPESSSSLNTSVHFEFRVERSSSPVRFVKLTLSGNDEGCNSQLVVCEIQLYGDRIVSTRKEVTMSSEWNNQTSAVLAVDGNFDIFTNSSDASCAVTQQTDHPWLNLDLGGHFLIHQLQIYGAPNNTSLDYGTEYFKNMSISFNGITVHQIEEVVAVETSPYYMYMPPKAIDVKNVSLTIDGENRTLVVCEVVVFAECEKGWYGLNCSSRCGHCKTGVCHASTGHCEACADGYQNSDPFCNTPTACQKRHYGTNCTETCGYCRSSEPCNTMTGECKGCEDGFTETDKYCKTACPEGTYGRNCTNICGHCKDGESCNKSTGVCRQCEDGFEELDMLCKTKCPAGKYGKNCTGTCGHCRNNETCNDATGECTDCADGYLQLDKLCIKVCPEGTYGPNCSESCGHCKNGEACNTVTGICTHCEDGFDEMDMLCNTSCPDSTYGTNCSQTCGYCQEGKQCNKTTGLCPEGGYGYTGVNGSPVCPKGRYGSNCSSTCGSCRDGSPCNFTDGMCIECEDGFDEIDLTCKTVCANGTYGRNCSETCGQCAGNEVCRSTDGFCNNCQPGYNGNDATCHTVCRDGYYSNCSNNCGNCRKPDICNKETGECPNGCEAGFMDSNCLTACPRGRYGINCTELCGICLNDEDCNKFTGECANGCTDGYEGSLCLEPHSEPKTPVALYAGSIAAGLAVCVVAVVVVLLRKRQRRLFVKSLYGGLKGQYAVHENIIGQDNKGTDFSSLDLHRRDSVGERSIEIFNPQFTPSTDNLRDDT